MHLLLIIGIIEGLWMEKTAKITSSTKEATSFPCTLAASHIMLAAAAQLQFFHSELGPNYWTVCEQLPLKC